MSDFSDRPLVAGSLTGVRAFRPDELGRLHGPSAGGMFLPGENVAKCNAATRHGLFAGFNSHVGLGGITPAEVRALSASYERLEQKTRSTAHQVAQVGCSCGYYAYFDRGSNPNADSTTVYALVEGFGVCSVGTRGFRAEKARLVALIDPDKKRWRDKRIDDLYIPSWFNAALIVWLTLATAFAVVRHSWWFAGLDLALAVLNVWWYPGARRAGKKRRDKKPAFERVRVAYPEVPVYPTLKAALADHPLTVPPPPVLPTPETDDDFWTRASR